jgi:hypothetical protein
VHGLSLFAIASQARSADQCRQALLYGSLAHAWRFACRSDQAVAVTASPDMSAAPPKKKLSHEIRDDPVYVNVLCPRTFPSSQLDVRLLHISRFVNLHYLGLIPRAAPGCFIAL